MRIVSLLPSATEIVCAVGARDELVGVSHECDFPTGVGELAVLTRPRASLPGNSGGIDRAVREMLRDAIAVYEVDVNLLHELRPDVIVTQDLCDVCAVSIDDVRSALRSLARDDVTLVSLRPTLLGEVWNDVRRVGVALGRAAAGEDEAVRLERGCEEISRRAAVSSVRPTVLTIEWIDPVMVGGTWMPELVTLAGGQPLVTVPGQHAPTLSMNELRGLDPDVVLIKPCGFDLERTASEMALLGEMLPWKTWTAVSEGRVFVADGNAYFNRSGPRLLESLEILAACLHPSLFPDFLERHVPSMRRVSRDLALAPCVSA